MSGNALERVHPQIFGTSLNKLFECVFFLTKIVYLITYLFQMSSIRFHISHLIYQFFFTSWNIDFYKIHNLMATQCIWLQRVEESKNLGFLQFSLSMKSLYIPLRKNHPNFHHYFGFHQSCHQSFHHYFGFHHHWNLNNGNFITIKYCKIASTNVRY